MIVSESGFRVITDPYEPGGFGGAFRLGPPQEGADVVLVSHEHADHNYVRAVLGNPEVVKGSRSVGKVSFEAVEAFHDAHGGREKGKNRLFCFELDGIRICHLGDLGHLLTEDEAKALGRPDVLFIPVGGTFTIDATQATEVVERLNPRLAIPMHFKNPKVALPLASVEDFLKGKENVERLSTSEVEISRATLPEKTKIVVLEPAR